jgi:hypothetical protein
VPIRFRRRVVELRFVAVICPAHRPAKVSRMTARTYLNRKVRDLVQDLTNKKKDRNLEDWARFGRVFVPIITSIGGVNGIITGLVAVLQHKKC